MATSPLDQSAFRLSQPFPCPDPLNLPRPSHDWMLHAADSIGAAESNGEAERLAKESHSRLYASDLRERRPAPA